MKKHQFNLLPFSNILQAQVLFKALILVGLIGWMDYKIGWEYSLLVAYALPIIFVVWKTNQGLGFAFALLCTMTWWGVHIDNNPYQSDVGFALAVFNQLFYFVVLVVAIGAVKSQQELALARIGRIERAQKLEQDILWASEREQQRIGRDLHDGLGSHLAAIGYALAFLAHDLHHLNQPEATTAEYIHGLVIDAISLLRDLLHGIFATQWDDFGLSLALEDLASHTARLSGLSVCFSETEDTLINNPEHSKQLYRIAQEAVTNAVKHADAKKITIVLSKCENTLTLIIADDGNGLALLANSPRGMGLCSMRYRARALGGDLNIDSNPNQGTTVSCKIPNPPPLSVASTS
ncbi:MAG: sensor histidine kinase [Methylococcales bacterium]|nr:sensor histidine kinase [Methylococcales bacterium]